ncbi:MAG: putative secreted lipase [Actinomycetia bacterium]|nr:putative secreted lipase [Actinomycetes bacterium]
MRRYLLGMVPQPDIPSLDRLIEDLRLLRAPGLLQLRRVPVDALYRAALHCGFAYAPDGESDKPAGIEALLHVAADRLDVTCGWLTGAKRAELNKLTGQLNTVIRAAAAKSEVHYVDITNALKGHEVCTKRSWVYEIGFNGAWNSEDGHPTFFGQHAISELVRRYINRWF